MRSRCVAQFGVESDFIKCKVISTRYLMQGKNLFSWSHWELHMTIWIMSKVSTFNSQLPFSHESLLCEKKEGFVSTKVEANSKHFTQSLIMSVFWVFLTECLVLTQYFTRHGKLHMYDKTPDGRAYKLCLSNCIMFKKTVCRLQY